MLSLSNITVDDCSYARSSSLMFCFNASRYFLLSLLKNYTRFSWAACFKDWFFFLAKSPVYLNTFMKDSFSSVLRAVFLRGPIASMACVRNSSSDASLEIEGKLILLSSAVA